MTMKRCFLATILISCVFIQAESQKIKGSDTCLPLTQKGAENYMKKNKGQMVTVTGGGSGVGMTSLKEGTTDIAMSSREIKFDEKASFKESGKIVKSVIMAYDAIAVVVNPSNKVSKLTREQLEGIFTGKIKNWKEVGGADMKIIPYSRETSSGTYEFFRSSVLKNRNYMSGIMSMPATGAVVQSIRQTPGAIGYIGLPYINKAVKPISISYDKGKSFIAPSMENAKNKTYPIIRPMYYYYLKSSKSKVESFLNYMMSEEGQRIVQELGYVPNN